jgi:hypothetical protein
VLVEQLNDSDGLRALSRLAEETGGLLLAENTRVFNRGFAATDARIDRVFQVSWRLYGQIAETYRFELPRVDTAREESWEIALPKEIEARVPGIQIRAPQKIVRCTTNSPS